MKRHLHITAILLLCLSGIMPAQTINDLSPVAHLQLPSGDSAWLVQVFTTGGFAGIGAGDFGISSTGRLICSLQESDCPEFVELTRLQSIIEVLPAVIPAVVPVPGSVITLCADCIKTTLVIRRRNSIGVETSQSFAWDVSTRGNIPPEVLQIYDAAAASKLKK